MENENPRELDATPTAAKRTDCLAPSRKRPTAVQAANSTAKTKKDQLIGFLSKPSGARVSVLVERGWRLAPFSRSQIHYVLANPVYAGLIRHENQVHDG